MDPELGTFTASHGKVGQFRAASSYALDSLTSLPSKASPQKCGTYLCSSRGNRGMEIRTVHLQSLAKQYLNVKDAQTEAALMRHRSWHQLRAPDQASLLRWALKPRYKFVLDPQAPYLRFWDIVLLLALVYCAIVTPWEVGFLLSHPPDFRGILFFLGCTVDGIFVKDMIMQFFIMVQVRDRDGNRRWIRAQKDIGIRYLRGWFLLDFVSVLPYETLGAIVDDPAIQRLKIVRIIRLLRLLKLARMLRATRLAARWEGKLLAVRNSTLSIVKFVFALVILSHWMACVWGLIGNYLGSNLTCKPGEPPLLISVEDNPTGRSWIVDRGDAWGPDSPCNPMHVYIASLHFAIMTVTSIGYGNIVPTRFEEYLVGVVCQLGGGITWAYVVGACCGIVACANRQKSQYERAMDALNLMLTENSVKKDVCYRAREFLREVRHHQFLTSCRDLTRTFSHDLRSELTAELAIGSGINQVYYFMDAPEMLKLDLAQAFVGYMLASKEVGDHLVGSLCILERGAVAHTGRILVPVMVWGLDVILTREDLQNGTPVCTLTYSDVLALNRDRLFAVVNNYPSEVKRLRRAAAKMALLSWTKLVCRRRSMGRTDSGTMLEVRPTSDSWPASQHADQNVTASSIALSDQSPSSGAASRTTREPLSPDGGAKEISDADSAILQELHRVNCTLVEGFATFGPLPPSSLDVSTNGQRSYKKPLPGKNSQLAPDVSGMACTSNSCSDGDAAEREKLAKNLALLSRQLALIQSQL